MEPLFEALAYARDLSLDEQRELRRLLSENIKYLEQVECVEATGFNIGDRVIAELRPKNEVMIEITGFSRNGMSIRGTGADNTMYIIPAVHCRKT